MTSALAFFEEKIPKPELSHGEEPDLAEEATDLGAEKEVVEEPGAEEVQKEVPLMWLQRTAVAFPLRCLVTV